MSSAQQIEIGSSTIFRSILIVLSFWFVYLVRDIVVMLFVAFIIASATEPVVNYLQKFRIPRAASILLIYLLFLAIALGFVVLLAEPVATQAYHLLQSVPAAIDTVRSLIPTLPAIDTSTVVDRLQEGISRFGSDLGNLSLNVFRGTRTVFSGLFSFVFVIVLAFYLTLEKDAIKKFAKVVTPDKHFPYVERIIERARRGVGRWVLGLLALGTIVGLLNGIGLWLLGVPYALLLGILAGLMEVVPLIGPVIATIVAVTVALSQSLTTALAVYILYLIVGLLEGYVLIPNIMRRAVGLRPIITVLAVLLGARFGGIIGIILAVPVAMLLSLIFSDIFTRPNNQVEDNQSIDRQASL